MRDRNVQKLIMALSPLSCSEVRQQFSRFLQDKIGQDQKEWVQEHLVVCDECLFALTDTVEQQVRSGTIPMQKFPSELLLPPMEMFFPARIGGEQGKQEMERERAEQLQGFNLSALKAVEQLARWADIHPGQIKKRLLNVGTILAVGLVGAAAALLAIGAGLPKSEPVRLLTMFFLAGSLALTFVASLAFALVSWSAFVYQYVRAERKKEKAHILLEAIIDLGRDPNFDRDIVNLVVGALRDVSPSAVGLTVGQASKALATSDLLTTSLGEGLSHLMRDYLARKKEVSLALDEEENVQRAT